MTVFAPGGLLAVTPLAGQTFLAQHVFFGILALTMAFAAIKVVTSQNVVHAAIYLMVVLGGAAGIYVMLAAEFVVVVQILVYIGTVAVLVVLGLFLTRAPIGKSSDLDNDQRWLGAIVALFVFGGLGSILVDAFGQNKIDLTPGGATAKEISAFRGMGPIGVDIFQRFVIPFEVVSIVLLAALVGAIVVARRD